MPSTIGALIRTRTRRIRHAVKFAFSSDEEISPKALKPRRTKNSNADFYDGKRTSMPRFVYRRLAFELANAADEKARRAIIEAFKANVETHGKRDDFQKFKWCLPQFAVEALRPAERKELESWFAERRAKRNRSFLEAFPSCADEFGVGSDFLNSVFDLPVTGAISPEMPVFTIGSCFARNIADFLAARGYNAEAFFQTEDLNSPLSNALMLAVATAEPAKRDAYLKKWLTALYAPATEQDLAALTAEAIARLDKLSEKLGCAAVVIVTIGNVLDFFLDGAGEPGGFDAAIPVAPKFLLLSDTVELVKRAALSNRLKAQGAAFRMATLPEARAAIEQLYQAIRRINPKALCIFTLSPVPMESAVGLQHNLSYGSVEIDCVSKSILRVALHELMHAWAASDPAIRYFPSYEIVRWIGPMLAEPAFGAEDASSRHVSSSILNGVYAFFLEKFGASGQSATSQPR